MSTAKYYYVASAYSATGEGVTISLLVTRAYPKSNRDYKVAPSFNDSGYNPGELKYPMERVALLEFAEIFDPFWAQGAEVLEKQDFFEKFGKFVPEQVKSLLDRDESPGNFSWNSHYHVNYS
jgi:hypothetical protein